jgi:hypothetical protein
MTRGETPREILSLSLLFYLHPNSLCGVDISLSENITSHLGVSPLVMPSLLRSYFHSHICSRGCASLHPGLAACRPYGPHEF